MSVSLNTPQRKPIERRHQRTRDYRLALCLEGVSLHFAKGARDGNSRHISQSAEPGRNTDFVLRHAHQRRTAGQLRR